MDGVAVVGKEGQSIEKEPAVGGGDHRRQPARITKQANLGILHRSDAVRLVDRAGDGPGRFQMDGNGEHFAGSQGAVGFAVKTVGRCADMERPLIDRLKNGNSRGIGGAGHRMIGIRIGE